MMTLLSGLISQYRIYVISIAILIAFLAGFKLAGILQASKELKAYNSLIQTIKDNDEKAREVIKGYQETQLKQQTQINTLTRKLKNVKIFSNTGNFTNDAVWLWNNSLEGIESPVPKDPTGIAALPSASSTVTIEDALHNKIVNDAICNGLRDQLISIIKWDKEVWNDFDSAGNTK